MALYTVTKKDSPLQAVEFSPVADGGFAFFYVKTPGETASVKQWLTSKEMGEEIIAETMVNGHPVLVTHGGKTNDEMMKILNDRGEGLKFEVHKKPFNFWALRGGMSVVGQSLQLASALIGVEQLTKKSPKLNPDNAHYNPKLKEGMWARKSFAADIGMFAILNLIANAANIVYGGQKEKGDNHLRHVKKMVNMELRDHLADDGDLIDVEDSRMALRTGPQRPPSVAERFNEFAKENSVRFFEIGLRFLGAIALVIPFKKASLGEGFAHIKQGQIKQAWDVAKNPVALTKWSGLGYLTGKIIALFSKVPDPYEEKKHTWLDTVREQYLFKMGGLIESAAGAGIMVNAYKTKKIGLANPNTPDIKPHIDWLGTVGGGLFASGYLVRMGAKFGEKHVDMNEVYAHASDTLAQTPPDQLPQLMAETAASLREHFKDKPLEFGEIFTKMMNDLYRYHHIALDNLGTEPEERVAQLKAEAVAKSSETEPGKFAAANPPRRTENRPAPTGFVDKVAQSEGPAPQSLGA